jgi:hypothetical protein
MIFEFQVQDKIQNERGAIVEGFSSIGWTILNVFDHKYELNTGLFDVPIYKSPTETTIDVRDISKLIK